MPHAEVGVQNDPIHAIVAAAQEILIQSAQPICHGGYARRTPAYFKLPRRGHFFAARSAKKRSPLRTECLHFVSRFVRGERAVEKRMHALVDLLTQLGNLRLA